MDNTIVPYSPDLSILKLNDLVPRVEAERTGVVVDADLVRERRGGTNDEFGPAGCVERGKGKFEAADQIDRISTQFRDQETIAHLNRIFPGTGPAAPETYVW